MSGTDLERHRTPHQELVAQVRAPKFVEQIQLALPQNVAADRFVRIAITALQEAPELVNVDRNSLFGALLKSAQDGLVPDGREAAIVKFKNDAAYIPMIGGLRKIAAEHGIALAAYPVYRADRFEYSLGMEPNVIHIPPPLATDRGELIGAYAVATEHRTGAKYLEVMAKSEVDAIRAGSRGKDLAPWTKHYDEMARKTVARRLWKSLPLVELDEREERTIRRLDEIEGPAEQIVDHQTVDEANLEAELGPAHPPDHPGPDDEASPIPAEPPVAEDDAGQRSFFEDAAERARRARETHEG